LKEYHYKKNFVLVFCTIMSNSSSHTLNPGVEFHPKWLEINPLNEGEIHRKAKVLKVSRSTLVTGDHRPAWLLKALTCIDLTTLAGDDTEANVTRLCYKALNPLRSDILDELKLDFSPKCGAVCVYAARVGDAARTLKSLKSSLPIASVATGFPAGQTSLGARIHEIKDAIADGATEIDVVINRRHAIAHDWQALFTELRQMRDVCGAKAHMKTILAVGELSSFTEVYQASMVAMMAGSDFIKTSTGKEAVNATIPVGLVMCRAIRDYRSKTGFTVGLKPAGGIRTSDDAIDWLVLVKEELGNEWLNPHLFRIGASGLLGDIEKELYSFAFGRLPLPNSLPVA
jgi:deoxyribose-phosphate aldolase